MQRFFRYRDKTEKFFKALKAMRTLFNETMSSNNGDEKAKTHRAVRECEQVFAKVVSNARRETYIEMRGFKESPAGITCALRLVKSCKHTRGGFITRDFYRDSCHPPGSDHNTMLLKDGKVNEFIMQPYELSFENMKKLVDYCGHNGLRADVTNWAAWYYPGVALAIVLTKNDRKAQGD